MTNTSLRQRFGIDPKNSAIASRLLKEALAAGMVRLEDEQASPNDAPLRAALGLICLMGT